MCGEVSWTLTCNILPFGSASDDEVQLEAIYVQRENHVEKKLLEEGLKSQRCFASFDSEQRSASWYRVRKKYSRTKSTR